MEKDKIKRYYYAERKFTTTSMSISAILGLIKANDIAIPEIQRPFVWKSKQVRDLIDSLYRGFPVGYIILWKNPNGGYLRLIL